MAGSLGPIDLSCDAPSYLVIRQCETLGMHAPLDVRWCRLSHFRSGRNSRWKTLGAQLWGLFFGARPSQPEEQTCSCSHPLPELEKYTFTTVSGKQLHYLLGQCRRCWTMFWEEV